MNPTGARLFSSFFIVLGLVVLYFGGRTLLPAHAGTTWPVAQGKVISSRTATHDADDLGTTTHAEVRYEYVANGRKQSSDRVAFDDYGTSGSGHAQRIVNRYWVGTTVTVHYSPDHPATAVLEPGILGQAWVLPGTGAIFFCAGLLMFITLPPSCRLPGTVAAACPPLPTPGISPTDHPPRGRVQPPANLRS